MINSGNGELGNAAYCETSHEENASTPNLRNNTAVHHDGYDTDRDQDAGVHKRTANLRHLRFTLVDVLEQMLSPL